MNNGNVETVTTVDQLAASGNPDMIPLLTHFTEMWAESARPFLASMYENAGLDVRVRELILIALLAMKGWEAGVQYHARYALDAGVDPSDIRGAILLTLPVNGVASASRGLLWVESCLQSPAE